MAYHHQKRAKARKENAYARETGTEAKRKTAEDTRAMRRTETTVSVRSNSRRNCQVTSHSRAFAWNSTPGMATPRSTGEKCSSWMSVPYSQTSTALSLNAQEGTFPERTSEREYAGYSFGSLKNGTSEKESDQTGMERNGFTTYFPDSKTPDGEPSPIMAR